MSKPKKVRDTMGEMNVPAEALYGASTQRAVENFKISGLTMPLGIVRALAVIKKCAAEVNGELGELDQSLAAAIAAAADQVIAGQHDEQFVVDVFQTGSGTSTNMNLNEVIATLAGKNCHPNDDVNRGQSSNDVFPSALHIAVALAAHTSLLPALDSLAIELEKKQSAFAKVTKIGRTHLQDAVPLTLGQEFSGYAAQVRNSMNRLQAALEDLYELPLGGTAVGTGLNAHPQFGSLVCKALSDFYNLPFKEADNHFEAQAARDACVHFSAALKTTAVSLQKIANDVRFLGSGPRAGLGELTLPALQPGSSIMPGKVNPVLCEALLQVCAQVIGNDAAVTQGANLSNFELNVAMPLMAKNILESLAILSNASRLFALNCIAGLEANTEALASKVEQSLMLATALVPKIGYDQAAEIAKEAFASNRTIAEVAKEKTDLSAEEISESVNQCQQ